MTTTINVLGGNQPDAPGAVSRYFVGQTEYYTGGGGEPAGQWFGGAALGLGLRGNVNEYALTNVLAGLSPSGLTQLVQIQRQTHEEGKRPRRRDRSPGFDFCFSLPKSLSAFYAVGTPRIRAAIDLAIDRATKKGIQVIESFLPMARTGKGGVQQETAKLLVAFFDHAVNRHLAPQRHRHCVIANVCQLADGTYRTINSQLLHTWTRTLGPMIRSEFAHEIKKELGILLELPLDENGKAKTAYEAIGVPKDLCTEWSPRKAEIDEFIAGDEGGLLGSTSAAAKQQAALETRGAKPITPPRDELYSKWGTEAAAFGFDGEAAEKLCGQASPVNIDEAYQAGRTKALADLTHQHSDFSERQFIQQLFEAIQHHGLSMDDILPRIAQDLGHSKDIVRLNPLGDELRYTTKEMWELEEQLIDDAKALESAQGAVVPFDILHDVISSRSDLSLEQAKAASELLADPSSFRVLTGVAGAGKSTTLDAVREALQRSGHEVLGGALAGVAAEELNAKAHIPSRTVASYLYHLDQGLPIPVDSVSATPNSTPTKESKRVLIIDEFGMLSTRTAAALIHHAKEQHITLIGVGDTSQIQPVDAGGPMNFLVSNLSQDRPHAAISENRRQRDPADRQAVQDIREGRAGDALKSFNERERIILGKNQKDTVVRLVDHWEKTGGPNNPNENLIFTQTRAQARVVNQLCQQALRQSGVIDTDCQIKIDKYRFSRGDHILIHAPIYCHGIKNGHTGSVLRVNAEAKTITIRLDLPNANRDPVVTLSLSEIPRDGITPSYARTINKGQGQSVDQALVLLGGSPTGRETAYTQATRGRNSTHFFVDRLQAGDELRDLAKMLEKSRAKGLAHELGLRIEIERSDKKL